MVCTRNTHSMRDTYEHYATMHFCSSLKCPCVGLFFRYFLHFDSHSGANDRHAESLAAKLYSLDDDLNFNNHPNPVSLSSNCICQHVFPCPQQSNTYDCGMYVVECARWLLNHSTIGVGDLDLLEVDPTKIGQLMSSVVYI